MLVFTLLVKAGNDHPDKYTVTETFYGEKASTNANNPCKGATVRQCATRQTKYDKYYTTNSYSLYNKLIEIRDENGILIYTEIGYLEVPAGTSIQKAVDREEKVEINWEG